MNYLSTEKLPLLQDMVNGEKMEYIVYKIFVPQYTSKGRTVNATVYLCRFE